MKKALSLSLVAALLAAPAARAQGVDLAAAQGLFDQAKQLVAQGKAAEACPKFLASFKLDPKPGTAVNLADCHERTGQIASAWARYLEAASLAQRMGQAEREQYARDHAAALEPKIARLTISATATPAGLEVLRDGTSIDVAILGTGVPVDPGKHQIEARAPGKKKWAQTVEIPAGPGKVTVTIPPLEDAPAGTVTQGPVGSAGVVGGTPGEAPARPFPRKAAGLAAIGVGGAGLVVGVVTGAMAIGKHGSLASSCKQGVCVGQDGALSTYHALGIASDVGLFAGGALAVTGIVLVATAPKAGAPPRAAVTPVLGPGFAGAAGRF